MDIFMDKILGKGVFSTTIRAKCDQLPCAAKYLNRERLTDSDVVRLEMAYQQLSMLRHPNIIHCLGTVRHGFVNRPILLLELMDENLSQFLQRFRLKSSGIPFHIKINFCHNIALGLAYLHENDIVHANLSSNNILVVGESRVKISDFWILNLTKIPSQMYLLQSINKGYKVIYSAPETLQAPPNFSRYSDTYSYGVVTIQIDNVCPPSLLDELGSLVMNCKQSAGRESHSLFTSLASICLLDDYSQRKDLKNVCEELEEIKDSNKYATSLQKSRDECQQLKDSLVVYENRVARCEQDIVQQDMIIKGMEQELTKKCEENKKLLKRITEHELFEQWLLWRARPGNDLLPPVHTLGQDEPDSATDANGDNNVFQAPSNDIHYMVRPLESFKF